MDVYLLDQTFRNVDVVDTFESCIWTERYSAFGDVTLTYGINSPAAVQLYEGNMLGMADSDDVMIIQTISEDGDTVTAYGISLTGHLQNRMFRKTWQTTADGWALSGTTSAIANYVVQQMVMAGGAMALGNVTGSVGTEIIPGLSTAPPVPGDTFTMTVQYGNLYDAVKAICDVDSLGFKMYPPNPGDGSGALLFLTYRGRDLTTAQSTLERVIFEPDADSFTDVKTVRSIAGYKNVAYAWASGMTDQSTIGIAHVDDSADARGFNRRTMMVDASDINAADYTAADLETVLQRRAMDALLNNNYVRTTDGTLVPQNTYVYGTDYFLGDIIELRGINNSAHSARLTEYIRAQSSEGETAYPTLSVIS